MTLAIFFVLVVIAFIFLFIDPKNHSNRWGCVFTLVSAIGIIDIYIFQEILPKLTYVSTHHTQKYFYEILDNFLITAFAYLFPYCVLMYGMSTSGIYYNRLKRKDIFILIAFIPVIIITPFFPLFSSYRNTYYLTFEIAINLLAIPYVLIGNGFFIYSFVIEKNSKLKLDKLITCLIMTPMTLYVLYMGYFLALFNTHARYWLTNKWAALYSIILFTFSSLSYGALGVKFKFEKAQLDNAMRAVSSGTAVLNHAIKNEVMNINLCAQTIKTGNERGDYRNLNKYCDVILNATAHMMAMVARIQENMREIEVETTPCNLVALAEESLVKVDHFLQAKNIKVHKHYDCKNILLCDPLHMEEVLQNIFKNAIEAMNAGGELHIQIYEHRKRIILSVKDNGSGISKRDLPHVIEPFFSTKARGGVNFGLGLSYCYNVMQKHGGSLELVSEEGKGTTVFLNFPVKKAVRMENQFTTTGEAL